MKFLILDGNSVLHRAYHALPDWRNRSGEATAGVYGFLSMLLKAIDELKPTHLVVVFDRPEPTFRHLMYVGYQVTREKDRQISEDIWGQVDKLKEILAKMGVPVYAVPGFEADDVIGTICRQIPNPKSQDPNKLQNSKSKTQNQVVIVTGDRDLMQLVDEKTKLYMPIKGLSDTQTIDRDKVKEKLGVWPEQVIDYKALVGDSSDNYPGVSGIGPRGAIDLISNYSNFENIYTSLGSIKEAVKRKLIAGYEGGELSRKLATIRTDVPLTLNWDKSSVPDQSKTLDVLKELGYKSLVKRVGGKEDEGSPRPRLFE